MMVVVVEGGGTVKTLRPSCQCLEPTFDADSDACNPTRPATSLGIVATPIPSERYARSVEADRVCGRSTRALWTVRQETLWFVLDGAIPILEQQVKPTDDTPDDVALERLHESQSERLQLWS